jgi:DNA-binding MarR family transcriptional regulator
MGPSPASRGTVTDARAPALDWEHTVRRTLHPTQVAILLELLVGDAAPVDLAARLGEPLGNVSYHARRLQAVGLIHITRTEMRRGAVKHVYGLMAEARVPPQAGPPGD